MSKDNDAYGKPATISPMLAEREAMAPAACVLDRARLVVRAMDLAVSAGAARFSSNARSMEPEISTTALTRGAPPGSFPLDGL
jgi:hypothetical protein